MGNYVLPLCSFPMWVSISGTIARWSEGLGFLVSLVGLTLKYIGKEITVGPINYCFRSLSDCSWYLTINSIPWLLGLQDFCFLGCLLKCQVSSPAPLITLALLLCMFLFRKSILLGFQEIFPYFSQLEIYRG